MNPFASQASYEPPAEGRSDSSVPLQMQQPLGGAAMPAPQTKVIFFHILFRALAVVTYMNPWHTGYVLTFVLVTILSALDFWTVQKVSGRLLVGLRWVNVIDDSGKSKWEFQSYEDQRFVHPTDSNAFWIALFAFPGVWLIFLIGAALTFKFMWLLLVVVALSLNGINLYGYVKCKRDAGRKLQALGGSVLSRGLQAWSGVRGAGAAGGGGGGV